MKSKTGAVIAAVAGVAIVGVGIYYYFFKKSSGGPLFSGGLPAGVGEPKPDGAVLDLPEYLALDKAVKQDQEGVAQRAAQPVGVLRSPSASLFDEATSQEFNAFLGAYRQNETEAEQIARKQRVAQAQYTNQISIMDLVNFMEDKKANVAAGLPANTGLRSTSSGTSSGGSKSVSTSTVASTSKASAFTPSAAGNAFRASLAKATGGTMRSK